MMQFADDFQRDCERQEKRRIVSRERAQQMAKARSKGTHTKEEWLALLLETEFACVSCGSQCIGGAPCKDHIISVGSGGSDAIQNLQPLCRQCNTRKGGGSTNYLAQWRTMRVGAYRG